MDIAIFLGLNLFVFLVVYLAHKQFFDIKQFFVWYLIYNCCISVGHIFATFYPSLSLFKNNAFNKTYVLNIILAVLLLSYLFFKIKNTLFHAFLAVFYIYHFARQNVGWVHISSDNAGEKRSKIDEFMVYNITFIPFIIYLANGKVKNKTMYLEGDLNLVAISSNIIPSLTIIFYGYICFYLALQAYSVFKHGPNIGKYILMASYFICSYISFLTFPEDTLFWAVSAFIHAVPYIIYTYKFSRCKISSLWTKNMPLYFIFLTGLGFILLELVEIGFKIDSLGKNVFFPLFWSLTMLHFVMDLFIWKRRFNHG